MFRTLGISLWTLALSAAMAPAQVRLEFAPPAKYIAALPLKNGNRLLVGSIDSHLVVSSLGEGGFTNTTLGGSLETVPAQAALDSAGNVWIAGETRSDDFPLVNPVFDKKTTGQTVGFLMELGAAGSGLLFSTYIGGSAPSTFQLPSTHATAIAFDRAGNVYVGGDTGEPDFFRTHSTGCNPSLSPIGDATVCSLAVKISVTGKLIYSMTLATGGGCTGSASGCIGRSVYFGWVSSMAADAAGNLVVAGQLRGTINLPNATTIPGGSYIMRISPDGSGVSALPSPKFGIPSSV